MIRAIVAMAFDGLVTELKRLIKDRVPGSR